MKRILNLGERIYFLTYGKPRYKTEISNKLYNRDCKQFYPEINRLVENNWIKELDFKQAITKIEHLFDDDIKKMDKRALTRKYYFAQTKPLYDSICERLEKQNISLDEEEQKKLMNFLDSKWFRRSIMLMDDFVVSNYEKKLGFLIVQAKISHLCLFRNYFEKIMRNTHQKISDSDFEKFMENVSIGIEEEETIEKFDRKVDAEVIKLGSTLQKKLTNLDLYTTILFEGYFDLLLRYIGYIYDIPLIKKREKDKTGYRVKL